MFSRKKVIAELQPEINAIVAFWRKGLERGVQGLPNIPEKELDTWAAALHLSIEDMVRSDQQKPKHTSTGRKEFSFIFGRDINFHGQDAKGTRNFNTKESPLQKATRAIDTDPDALQLYVPAKTGTVLSYGNMFPVAFAYEQGVKDITVLSPPWLAGFYQQLLECLVQSHPVREPQQKNLEKIQAMYAEHDKLAAILYMVKYKDHFPDYRANVYYHLAGKTIQQAREETLPLREGYLRADTWLNLFQQVVKGYPDFPAFAEKAVCEPSDHKVNFE